MFAATGAATGGRNAMSTDTEKHRALLSALRDALGKGDGSFERAVTDAFEHVFEHLVRLNDHVSLGGPDGSAPHLKPGESPTLR
ncbi:hypothetical protein GCM10008965_42330 [Methylorubrum aminovorans]